MRRIFPKRMGGLLNRSLESLGIRKKVLEQQAMGRWAEVVGTHISNAARPRTIIDGTLFVACKSSVWANELTLNKKDIIDRLNNAMRECVVKDIRFSSRGYKQAEEVQEQKVDVKPGSIRLSEEELRVAEDTASKAPSSELAEKIRKAVIAAKKLEKARSETRRDKDIG